MIHANYIVTLEFHNVFHNILFSYSFLYFMFLRYVFSSFLIPFMGKGQWAGLVSLHSLTGNKRNIILNFSRSLLNTHKT